MAREDGAICARMIGRDELKGQDKVHSKKNRGTAFIERMIVGAATVAVAIVAPQASLMAQENAGAQRRQRGRAGL